ncbi:hypothetical protein [uncultured Psychroserpens sp.]|uniref:hypothetical protein n=1 Tax=uncultured Psychroserpens sp. TaxID=255436 RepID=UPI00261070A9|nr:hypothetical protein [uncultured Psychroserpens sp.]
MSKKPKPIVLTLKEMERKGTRELLGYLNKLHKCEESFESSDLDKNPDLTDKVTIYFKQTEKWKIAYKDVKSILKNREHIK